MVRKDIVVFSTYDLSDATDGASLHLANILQDVALEVSVMDPLMKQRGIQFGFAGLVNRTSFGFACVEALRAMVLRKRSAAGLLLGMHALLLAPFFDLVIYVPMDCWSARERALAANGYGARGVLRAAYARLVALCETVLIHRCSIIAVISPAEAEKLQHLYPSLDARIMILPLRNFYVSGTAQDRPRPIETGAPVTIWMDARPDYGRQSILACLDYLARLAREEPALQFQVTVLSRNPDLVLKPDHKARNIPFTEDIESFLRQQSLVILPDLQGSGVKNRALQAASLGVPILATPVALEGLDWAPFDRHALVYDGYPSFRAALNDAVAGEASLRAGRLFKHLEVCDPLNSERRTRLMQRIAALVADPCDVNLPTAIED